MIEIEKKTVKFGFAFLGAVFFFYLLTLPAKAPTKHISDKKEGGTETHLVKKDLVIKNLGAHAVFVYDMVLEKTIFAKNERMRLPLASLNKLMVVAVVQDLPIPKNTIIKITNEAIRQIGDSGLREGDGWFLKDLLDFALVKSSNDAIRAVASAGFLTEPEKSSVEIFVEKMNQKAKDMSLEETYFLNDTGLDISDNTSGGYGSAKDMATLIAHLYNNYPETVEATSYHNIRLISSNSDYETYNTNRSLESSPRILASKTGYTDLAGGNLAVVFDLGFNHPIAVALLGSGEEERFKDMENIIKSVYSYYEEK